ncbi:MAG: alpha-mannosidase, partial [Candidatus Bathyarchaeia archaeon]
MFVYGVGDHGGGPTFEDAAAAHEIQKKPALPRVTFSSAQEFFREIEAQLNGVSLPVVKDELNTIFDGCYTTHGDIKRYNRLCERLLVDAEKLCVASGVYPREKLRRAWLNMLFNQFHDILCGSGTHEAYDYPRELAEETVEIARDAIRTSMERIANSIQFSRSGVPVVVFNALSWDRTDIVRAEVPGDLIPENPIVVSADGETGPAQVTGDEVLFVAEVPSMGYKTYYLTGGGARFDSLVKDGDLENKYLKVELDEASGAIGSMYDKVNGRFVFKKVMSEATRPEASNLLQVLYEAPHRMSAWIIGEISRVDNLIRGADVHLVEDGPVRATVKVVHRFSNSEITQYVSLYRGVPRVDFHTVIDWREVSDEKTDAPMLKVSFTPILGTAKATFEIPFGYIERPSDGKEVPALRWVDLSDEEYGVSLLNDSKYGFDVKGNTVRMTLVRTSYSPDTRPDYGKHEILYSIYPHKGDWRKARTFRRGYEVSHPLESIVVTNPSKGRMPETKSFIQVKPENVVVSCVKKAEDSNDIVVRMYDATGEGAEAELILGFKAEEAAEVNLMEKEIGQLKMENGTINVSLKPFEIKTIIIKCMD